LAGADPELNSTNAYNDPEMKKEAEETKPHRMSKVHDFLETCQGSQNVNHLLYRRNHTLKTSGCLA